MISENLLGWFTLLLVFFIIYLITEKNPKTKKFLLIALCLRTFLVILDEYFMSLPLSDGDATTFEKHAHIWSIEQGYGVISNIFTGSSYFISYIIAIFYVFLDRSEMMVKMFSVGFGTASVYLIYRLTQIIWGTPAALKAGWISALFPSFVLYSSLIMREPYIVFFLVYALIHCVLFLKNNRFINIIKLFFGFFLATLFHGPIILGLFIFIFYVFFQILFKNKFFFKISKKNYYSIFLIPIILLPIITYVLGYYSIPKVGNIKNIGSFNEQDNEINTKVTISEKIIWKIKKASRLTANDKLGSNFPSWIIPENLNELIYLSPVRMFYLFYSPLPWDVKTFKHCFGLLDSFLYFYLTLCIWRNAKIIYENPQTRFLLIILILFIFIYSFGVGNFGTSMRHRLKFIGILITIAAQKTPNIKFFRNK